jgi:hypothetical protein
MAISNADDHQRFRHNLPGETVLADDDHAFAVCARLIVVNAQLLASSHVWMGCY